MTTLEHPPPIRQTPLQRWLHELHAVIRYLESHPRRDADPARHDALRYLRAAESRLERLAE